VHSFETEEMYLTELADEGKINLCEFQLGNSPATINFNSRCGMADNYEKDHAMRAAIREAGYQDVKYVRHNRHTCDE